jgi:hypothetical protein
MGIEHSKHIFRIFILLAIVIAGALIGRILSVPETHGLYGHYRGASVLENAQQEVRHGGNESCTVACHTGGPNEIGETFAEIVEAHDGGPHAAIPCEDCHDAKANHAAEDTKIADMPRTKSVLKLCARCHAELEARPEDFPQVNIKTHPVEMGADEASDEVCFDCHSPHDPTP